MYLVGTTVQNHGHLTFSSIFDIIKLQFSQKTQKTPSGRMRSRPISDKPNLTPFKLNRTKLYIIG
jgi:hypothetical protein